MGSYNRKNPTNRLRAARLLKELLPQAREAAKSVKEGLRPTSGVGENTLRWFRTEDCIGVHVYQGDQGGWFADLQFANLPLGVADTVGIPSQLPAKDRQDAIRQAVHLLAIFMHQPKPEGPADAVDAIFALDEVEMRVPADVLRGFRERSPDMPTVQEVVDELERLRMALTGGAPITMEVVRSLSEPALQRLQIACALAVLAGMPRYPEYQEAPPPPAPGAMH